MGSSTKFKGHFTLTPQLSMAQFAELKALEGEVIETDRKLSAGRRGNLRGYCQWTPTNDGCGLQWDGGEKFYDYVDWLAWLIDTKFTPWGITVSGSVKYKGDYQGEAGTLHVDPGPVVRDAPWTISEKRLGEIAGDMYKLLQDIRDRNSDVNDYLNELEDESIDE